MAALEGHDVSLVQIYKSGSGKWTGRSTSRSIIGQDVSRLAVAAGGMAGELCYRFSSFSDVDSISMTNARYKARGDQEKYEKIASHIPHAVPSFEDYVASYCWLAIRQVRNRHLALAQELMLRARAGRHVLAELMADKPITLEARQADDRYIKPVIDIAQP